MRLLASRPSTTNYSTGDPNADAGKVLQTVPALRNRIAGKPDPDPTQAIAGEIPRLQAAGIAPTADLVYTLGSSLDPHITPEVAQAQVQRIAGARNLDPARVEEPIPRSTDGRFFSIFGEPGVNVLRLNLALDALP